MNIQKEDLHFFKGKHVRIVPHVDLGNGRVGQKAAARWAEQLKGTARKIDAFQLEGLRTADGNMIADTPGFGAVQTGDGAGSHEEALKDYLKKEVSQVFWVVRAEVGIGKSEMTFHVQWLDGICDDIIVTGCEDWSQTDRRRFEHRFGEEFKKRIPPTFHFVSGLGGLRAREANDATPI